MKIRNNIILTAALIIAVFILGACSFPGGSDSLGSIIINFDNSGARYAGAESDATMEYSITLTSPGKNTITRTTKSSISIPVSEGAWKIEVKAKGEGRVSEGKGEDSVVVTAGKPASANIGMNVTGTRVSSWTELADDFKELNDPEGKLKYLEEIEIVETFYANSAPNIILNNKEKTITLFAKTDVMISRDKDNTTASDDYTVFTISNGTLILDGTKAGNITIEGNKRSSRKRALINVDEGTLKMYDGVTLTNNSTEYGGGVHVKGNNSYFYMYGGTISKNIANNGGGGVCIRENGHFYKTGGIIFGKDAGINSNTVSSNGSGSAVYFEDRPSISIDIDLDSKKNEKGEDIP
jgi:hypothetical protein